MNIDKKIDKIFNHYNSDTPGASVAVSKDGEIIFRKGYGRANLEYNIPIKKDTIFHVASVSKQFTAMSILLLEKKGLLNIDDPIQTYLPDFPSFQYEITIRHLLHHVSGLRDQWQLLVYGSWRMDDVITHNHIMKMLLRQKELNFKPGTKYLYCNSGYTLMAEIVKRVSGKSLAEFAKESIFEPLSMNNTHFHYDHEHIVKNRAYSYMPYYDSFKKKVLSYANIGATSLFTTTEDLIKWSNNFDKPKVGDKDLLEKMLTVYTLENGEDIKYACGLNIDVYNNEKTISHGGADAGFRTHFLKFPNLGYTIVVLTNITTSKPEILAKHIADEIIFEKKDLPEKTDDPVSSGDLTGIYLVDPGNVINIELKDKLYIHLPRVGKSTLSKIETKDNLYKIDLLNENILTRYDEQGNVELLLYPLYGKDIVAKKIDCININNVPYEKYIGTYYSEELETTYYIEESDNSELVIKHKKLKDIPLVMIESNVFEGKYGFARLTFLKNDINKVVGFNLTGGRVKNIHFKKV
ncbi:MAG: serine hydrolase domain-containing protein [Clostridia bacterium]